MRPTAMARLDSTHRDLSIGMGDREGPGGPEAGAWCVVAAMK